MKQYLSKSFAVLVLLFLLCGQVTRAGAQSNGPLKPGEVTCGSEQKYKGLEFCRINDGKGYVVVADLNTSGMRLEYVIAAGKDRNGKYGECQDVNRPDKSSQKGCYEEGHPNYFPVMSLSEAVSRYPNAAVVIDSDYGAGTQSQPDSRDHGPEGFTVMRGTRLDGIKMNDQDDNAVRRPWLAVSKDAPLRAEFGKFSKDDGSAPGWIYTGIGGAPWLIKDGKVATNDARNCTNAAAHSCNSTVAQTAVGLSKDGRWLYLVITFGQNAEGTANFMSRNLNVQQAIKWDGGGSSQLYYGGLSSNNKVVTAGDNRKLSQYLAVLAPAGSGIEEDLPDGKPGEGIFQKIWNSILHWLQELKARFQDWLDQEWEGIQQRISDWLQTVFTQWLEQLCGSVGVPVGAIISLAWLRRQRRQH